MKHTIDATNKSVGRIATEVAHLLQGKNDPAYNPRLTGTNHVEVTNASKVRVSSPGKYESKKYHWHTGYMGHLRTKTLKSAMEIDPTWVLKNAIYNMLPKNRLRRDRLLRLTVKA